MEKKLYELGINEKLEHVMPPLQDLELKLLRDSLLTEGCRDPLVTWKGVIVDGHNRYRICRENNIPFSYVEMEFADETAAKMWIIRNQLARRNVPDYVRVELVLPLEAELKAEAKKRQGTRNDLTNIVQNSAQSSKGIRTRDILSDMAGVSRDTLDKAKKLATEADEDTKEQLRKGKLSIHGAYTNLKEREGSTEPVHKDLFPGHGLVKEMPDMEEGAYVRPPDSVYDIPPVEVYGNMPSDNMELRGRAEYAHVKYELEQVTEWYENRAKEIIRSISTASANEENIDALCAIVTRCNEGIVDALKAKLS